MIDADEGEEPSEPQTKKSTRRKTYRRDVDRETNTRATHTGDLQRRNLTNNKQQKHRAKTRKTLPSSKDQIKTL